MTTREKPVTIAPMPLKKGAAHGEFGLIAAISKQLALPVGSAVEVGIGDDAAVLRVGRERLVVTVDDQVEGVHFDRRWLSAADIGYRSLQAAASDIAAMGAAPLAAVANLRAPRDFPRRVLLQLAAGQAQAAKVLRCPVVGGNVARGSELSVTTTVLGRVNRPLLRSGARAGDELWVVGELGLSRAGLRLHQLRLRVPRALSVVAARCRQAWARPRALVAEGQRLVGRARAVLDVSDGLAGDLGHLARQSGVKGVLEARLIERLCTRDFAELCDLLGEPAVALCLKGGEDYALLAAGPRARRPRGARVVGRIEQGEGVELELGSGQRFGLGGGFDHYTSSSHSAGPR